jgi:hypothetical protein
MSERTPKPIGCYILAVVIGVLPGLFIVGVVVFANGAPILSAERLVPVIVTYVSLGGIFSFIYNLIRSPVSPWRWGIWMSIPAFASIALLGRDLGLKLQSLYFVITLASACLGAYIGMWIALLIRGRK